MFLITNGTEIIAISYKDIPYTEKDNNIIIDNLFFDKNGLPDLGYLEIQESELKKYREQLLGSGSDLEFLKSYHVKDGKVLKNTEFGLKLLRIERNELLEKSDKLSGIIYPDIWKKLNETTQTEWLEYRQKLRDITSLQFIPEMFDDFPWPSAPKSYQEKLKEEQVLSLQEFLEQQNITITSESSANVDANTANT